VYFLKPENRTNINEAHGSPGASVCLVCVLYRVLWYEIRVILEAPTASIFRVRCFLCTTDIFVLDNYVERAVAILGGLPTK
jgi:hypothetical protein